MLFRRLLLLLILAGVLTGAFALAREPRPAPVVELALDYTSARRFAAQQAVDLHRLLAEFRAAGITTLLLGETSLADLVQQGQMGYPPAFPVQVAALTGPEVLSDFRVQGEPPPPGIRLDEGYLFVRHNPALAEWLEQMLIARLGPERVRRVPSPAPDLAIIGMRAELTDDFMLMPLGILPADVEVGRRSGLHLAGMLTQRPRNLNPDAQLLRMRTADPAAVAATLPPEVQTVYIRGAEVPGYPDQIPALAAALRSRGVALAIRREAGADRPFPAGLPELAEQMNLRAVKALPVSYRDRPEDWVTAAKDREIRMLIFEAFVLTTDGEKDLALQTAWLKDLTRRLTAVGLQPGPAPAPPATAQPAWVTALLALAAAAGALELVFRFWTPAPGAHPALVAGAAAGAVAVLAAAPALALLLPVTGAQLLALAAALAFPSLGAVAAASRGLDAQLATAAVVAQRGGAALDWRWRADAAVALQLVLRAALWSIAGGVLVNALLADHRFWLELALFRGVKLALLAPSAALLVYWAWQVRDRFLPAAGLAANSTVRLGHLLLGGGALLVLLVLVVRSTYAGVELGGATLTPVSGLELAVRAKLEQLLYVRPRTKEVLFAYPALFLAAYLLRRGKRTAGMLALTAGALAGASVVNTFVHAHIPAGLSALRSFHGLWLGLLAGGLLLALLKPLQSLWQQFTSDAAEGDHHA